MSLPGVLVVNSSRSWGGNEHWAVSVAAGLRDLGHPVRFAWSHDVVGEKVAAAGLPGAVVRLGGDADPRGILALRREMLAAGARAVLLTRWREYLQGGLAARLAGRPRVVMGLGLLIEPRGDLKRRLVFRLADRILVNAPEIRESLLRRPWIPDPKVAVVVNGLDLPRWQPRWLPAAAERGLAFRRRWGLAADAPLLVNIGSLTRQKDQANLVAACRLLAPRHPGLRALILGDGSLRAALAADISRSGLDQVVTLAGFSPAVGDALAAADLFVLSSANEGMAWVLMEAAASGLPAVTTEVSGARFCVRDGVTGLVVPCGDPAALAGAVEQLLRDPARRLAMGRQARALAEERFDARRMIGQTRAVLFD